MIVLLLNLIMGEEIVSMLDIFLSIVSKLRLFSAENCSRIYYLLHPFCSASCTNMFIDTFLMKDTKYSFSTSGFVFLIFCICVYSSILAISRLFPLRGQCVF